MSYVEEAKANCTLILDSSKLNPLSEILPHLSPLLIEILDLFGTMAFAVTGAFKAIGHIGSFGIIRCHPFEIRSNKYDTLPFHR